MPVAVIIISAVIFSPDLSNIPSDSNCFTLSVTTDALFVLIALNKSLSGTRHIL